MNNTGLVILLVVLLAVVLIGGGIFLFGNNAGSSSNTNSGGSSAGNGGTDTGSQEAPKTYRMDIANFAFSNKELRIKQGDTVIWTNKDDARHTVTSDSGSELNSELLADEESYSHTFSQKGSFAYHCTPHPNMKATIIVE